MHLVSLESAGSYLGADEAVDLDIPAGDIIMLSSADTDLLLLSNAAKTASKSHDVSIRLANYMALTHPYAVDLFVQKTLGKARMIIVRLLGGKSYWPYGVEQLQNAAKARNIPFLALSGEGKQTEELAELSSVSNDVLVTANQYLVSGGAGNAHSFYDYLLDLLNGTDSAAPPQPFLPAGLYWPSRADIDIASLAACHSADQPMVAIVFYRALLAAGDLDVIDALIAQAKTQGLNPIPIYVSSLKDAASADITSHILRQLGAGVILNLTSFAVSDPNATALTSVTHHAPGPFGVCDAPVFQLVSASMRYEDWKKATAGLSPRDLAMHVALPELDGRILTRAVGVKSDPNQDADSFAYLVKQQALPDRIHFVMTLAKRWAHLRGLPNGEKRSR